MATKRMIVREKRLLRKGKDQAQRNKLKAVIKSSQSTAEEVLDAVMRLQKRPVDESPSRQRRRCKVCGRPHGVLRRFGMCRLCLRKFAMKGFVPGLVKSSW